MISVRSSKYVEVWVPVARPTTSEGYGCGLLEPRRDGLQGTSPAPSQASQVAITFAAGIGLPGSRRRAGVISPLKSCLLLILTWFASGNILNSAGSSPSGKHTGYDLLDFGGDGTMDILHGLDGVLLSSEDFTSILRESGDLSMNEEVVAVDLVPGSELRWPQSHSAKLALTIQGAACPTAASAPEVRFVYLKKVLPRHTPSKSFQILRSEVASNRNEARFYQEFASFLADRKLPLIKAFLVDERLILDAVVEIDKDEASDDNQHGKAEAGLGGMLLLLESAEGYWQTSPLSSAQAARSLKLLAKFHAAAWEDATLLPLASQRLHRVAGYWTLDKRGEKEMHLMHKHWQQYLETFTELKPELLLRTEILNLAQRIERIAPWVAGQLAPTPKASFATMAHGDYKAMNIFLRSDTPKASGADMDASGMRREPDFIMGYGGDVLPIDFQWTGLGFGMSDVAMHLTHSVAVEALQGDGEHYLVDVYFNTLQQELSRGPNPVSEPYTRRVADRHYCLAVVDYARMVLGCFFKNASPQAFAARADQQNVGLAYRNIEASFLFVARADRCLRVLEEASE